MRFELFILHAALISLPNIHFSFWSCLLINLQELTTILLEFCHFLLIHAHKEIIHISFGHLKKKYIYNKIPPR